MLNYIKLYEEYSELESKSYQEIGDAQFDYETTNSINNLQYFTQYESKKLIEIGFSDTMTKHYIFLFNKCFRFTSDNCNIVIVKRSDEWFYISVNQSNNDIPLFYKCDQFDSALECINDKLI